MKFRPLLATILKFTAAVLFLLLIIECGSGIFWGWPDPLLVNPPDVIVQVNSSEFHTSVQINSQGFREQDRVGAKAPGLRRVIFIGDSHMFGWGVEQEESIPQTTRNALQALCPDTNVQAVNLGRPGAEPDDYWRVFSYWAPVLNPDAVVVGYLLGNDDVVGSPPSFAPVDISLVPNHVRNRWDSTEPRRPLWKSSASLALIHKMQMRYAGSALDNVFSPRSMLDFYRRENLVKTYGESHPYVHKFDLLAKRGWVDKAFAGDILPYRLAHGILNSSYWADILCLSNETLERTRILRVYAHGFLRAIAEDCEQAGLPVFFLGVAPGWSVSPAVLQQHESLGGEGIERLTNLLQNDIGVEPELAFLDFCKANKLQCASALRDFREVTRQKDSLYFPIDGHVTALGNRMLGDIAANMLKTTICGMSQRKKMPSEFASNAHPRFPIQVARADNIKISASSARSGHGPEFVFDTNEKTYWSADAEKNQYLELKFPRPVRLFAIGIKPAWNNYAMVKDIEIKASADGSSWDMVAHGEHENSPYFQAMYSNSRNEYRSVRIYADSSWSKEGDVGVSEIMLFVQNDTE